MSYASLIGPHYDKVKQLMNTRFEQAEQYARSKFERFYRWEKLFHMVSKKKVYDWKANAFLPYSFSMAEMSASIKWLALFDSRPYVSVQARRPELDAVALRRQALIDWRLTGEINSVDVGQKMFRISERYGKAIAKVTPRWDVRTLKFRDRALIPTAYGNLARMYWKQRQRREYKIDAIPWDNTDFFPQPGKRSINGPHGMRYCFDRDYFVMNELIALQNANLIGPATGGEDVNDIKDSQAQDLNEYKMRRLFLDKYDDIDRYYDHFERSVEIINYQGIVPPELLDPERSAMEEANGLDPTNRLMSMANRSVVVMDIALPWDHGMKGFIEMDCVPDPFDFWGKGKIEPIEHLNYVGNEIVNMRLDNVKMAINALIGVDGTRMPTGWKRRLMSQPFGVLETAGTPKEVIHRIPMGDVTSSSYTEQQQLFSLIQEADGLNETLMGAPGPMRTLGEHQLKAESSSRRLKFELVGQAQQLLGFPYGLSGFIIGLDRQYLPIPTYVTIANPDAPDDFMSLNVDYKTLMEEDELFAYLPTGATEGMNIQAKRADLGQLLMALEPFAPILMQTNFDFGEMVRTIIKTFGYDPARFFQQVPGAIAPEGRALLGAGGQGEEGGPSPQNQRIIQGLAEMENAGRAQPRR